MIRRSFIFTICFLALFIFTSHVNALFDSDVDKAKEFMQAGMYPQAIALLEKEINDNPTNAEAHFQLGICYINQNNYSGADERFASAVRLKADYGYKIGKEFKKASDASLKKGSLSTTSTLFDKATIYDPSFKKQGYDFFMTLGDRTQSVHYYDRALLYAKRDKERQKKIGFKFLKLAVKEWPGARCDSLKQKASKLIGEKIVQEVFPLPYVKTTFEKTYTYDDAYEKEYGQIHVIEYRKVDIQVGDEIEIIARLKGKNYFDGKEIYIWQGKSFTPKWASTKNGFYTERVQRIPTDAKYYGISLDKRKDIEVTVGVKRKIAAPPPNIDLLNEYMASFGID